MRSEFIAIIPALAVFTHVSEAAIIARFDVGGSNANGAAQNVQATWADVNPTNSQAGVTNGGVTLTIGDTSPESRDRTGPVIAGNPLENVFRDFIFTRSTDGAVPITFSGLLANTAYEITGYAYDSSGGNNETGFWYLGSVDPGNLQHTWTSSIATLDNPGDIFTLTGTSNGSGVLTYFLTTTNTSRINGFEVNQIEAIPEPSVALLSALGLLALLRRHR